MKFMIFNGSPRKKWNTSQMLNSFIDGIKSVDNNADIKLINLYSLNYKGCMSCFKCKLKDGTPFQCGIKDDIYDLLIETRNSDAIVFGSPVYFYDLPAQLRGFMERLLYPGPSNREIPSAFLYSMNANEDHMNKLFKHNLDSMSMFVEHNFHSKPEQIFAFTTYQRDNEELYLSSRPKLKEEIEAKKRNHEIEFPLVLKECYQLGFRMATKSKIQ